MSVIDPYCLHHGKRRSEHEGGRCLYCCICFKPLEPHECWEDSQGAKWDMCEECGKVEGAPS